MAVVAIKTLSEFKLNLRTVLSNLNKLEEVKQNGGQISDYAERLVLETDTLIAKLECTSTTKFTKLVAKRKKLRKLKKLKKKRELTKSEDEMQIQKESEGILELSPIMSNSATDEIHTKRELKPNLKPHQQLRQYHDAKMFLRRFELLKELHLMRSQDAEATQEFASQFDSLQSTWHGILQANVPDRCRESQVEDQWMETFFGANEHNLKNSDHKLADLIGIRQIWDSYLTNDIENGSSIPTGWVLPTEQPDNRWLVYRMQPSNALESSSSTPLNNK